MFSPYLCTYTLNLPLKVSNQFWSMYLQQFLNGNLYLFQSTWIPHLNSLACSKFTRLSGMLSPAWEKMVQQMASQEVMGFSMEFSLGHLKTSHSMGCIFNASFFNQQKDLTNVVCFFLKAQGWVDSSNRCGHVSSLRLRFYTATYSTEDTKRHNPLPDKIKSL